jgi:hypothetical protein
MTSEEAPRPQPIGGNPEPAPLVTGTNLASGPNFFFVTFFQNQPFLDVETLRVGGSRNVLIGQFLFSTQGFVETLESWNRLAARALTRTGRGDEVARLRNALDAPGDAPAVEGAAE